MKKLFINMLLVLTILFAGGVATSPSISYAAAKDDVCAGISLTDKSGVCTEPTTGPTVNKIIELAINLFSLLVGVAAVIMVIIGGLKYITSSGDSNNINSAKNTILYAIIGLVVVALAQVIVKFVLQKAAA